MVKINPILFFVFQCMVCTSQTISGEVVYTKKLDFEELKGRMTQDNNEQTVLFLEKLQKESQDNEYVLSFRGAESNYAMAKKLTNDSNGGVFSKLSLGKFIGEFYFDFQTKEAIHKKEHLGEPILMVLDTGPKWKILDEGKNIGGYKCIKAEWDIIYNDIENNLKHNKIIAWYALELKVPFGPEKYNSLPGLILEVDDGRSRIVAKKIKIHMDLDIVKIKKPKGGREITEKELEEEARKIILQRMGKTGNK